MLSLKQCLSLYVTPKRRQDKTRQDKDEDEKGGITWWWDCWMAISWEASTECYEYSKKYTCKRLIRELDRKHRE